MNDESRYQDFFRCPVQADQAKATIRCGWTRIPVTLRETSIDGFTVLVPARFTRRLRVGQPWVLTTSAEKVLVHGEWIYMAAEGAAQLGLRRVRDLTPAAKPRGHILRNLFSSGRRGNHGSPELVLGGLVLMIVVILSTPALGDPLGTAPRIRRLVLELMAAVRSWLT